MLERKIDIGIVTSIAARPGAEQVDTTQDKRTLGLPQKFPETIRVGHVAHRWTGLRGTH